MISDMGNLDRSLRRPVKICKALLTSVLPGRGSLQQHIIGNKADFFTGPIAYTGIGDENP